MSSTDSSTLLPDWQQRLTAPAPLPGLAERQLGSAIRAYARRASNLASGLSLRGLNAIDQKLHALMQAARYYGPALLQDLQGMQSTVTRQEGAGFAFVHVALSQQHDASWDDQRRCIDRYWTAHPGAVRDALWFFGDSNVCTALLQDADERFVRLGVELAGRMALPQLLAQVHDAANQGIHTDECVLACTRIGQPPERVEAHISEVLRGYDLARQMLILETLAALGGHALQPELRQYIDRLTAADGPTEESHPEAWASVVDTAMSLWTARDPLQALNAVIAGLRIPNKTALRVVAMAGHIDGLLPVLAHLEGLDRAFDSAEQDVVCLVFGYVPGELSNTMGDQAARRTALRRLACDVFASNGCTDLKPEHITHWSDASVKERLWALGPVRLRHGRPAGARHLLDECFDLSHALRRWLYVAHTHQTGRPCALAHEDFAMRQMKVVESILLLHSMEAGDDEV